MKVRIVVQRDIYRYNFKPRTVLNATDIGVGYEVSQKELLRVGCVAVPEEGAFYSYSDAVTVAQIATFSNSGKPRYV